MSSKLKKMDSKIKIIQSLEENVNAAVRGLAEYINKRILEDVMKGVKRGSNYTPKKKKRK